MRADLLAGCSGTEWNPKDPVALISDYRCCSEGMRRDRMDLMGGLGLAHNPEVEGSNPSPATKLDQHVRRFTSFAKGQPDGAVSVICQWTARTSVRAYRLG